MITDSNPVRAHELAMKSTADNTTRHPSPFLNSVPKSLLLGLLTASLMSVGISAQAGGGEYCGSNFSLDNRYYNACQINFPTLDTGNDTQTNLYLLLADKGLITFDEPDTLHTSGYYYDFPLNLRTLKHAAVNQVQNPNQSFLEPSETSNYAEYCNSFYTGKTALENALTLDQALTPKERAQLMQFRDAIRSECADSFDDETAALKDTATFPLKWSVHAQPYADYIMATQLFYLGKKSDFDSAHNLYSALTTLDAGDNAGRAWLLDTVNYMLIRTGINRIYQQGAQDYVYDHKTVDPRLFASTQSAINTYLSRFKKGQYTASARGLQRRLYWLSGKQEQLVDEIEWQIEHTQSLAFNLDSRRLPEEIERRLFFPDSDKQVDINVLNDPILLTSFALYRLRPASDLMNTKPITLAALERLKPKFKGSMDLYQYLIATYYFVQENNSKRALTYLPTATPTGKLSYTQFSQYALKAKALQQLGRTDEANTLWQQLHTLPKQPFQNTVTELALALHADKTNDYRSLFTDTSIQSQALKMRVIKYSADPTLLKQIADNHANTNALGAEARYALLAKSLIHGRYDDYLTYQQRYLPKDAQKYQGYSSKDETLKHLPTFSQFNWQGKHISPHIKCQNLTTTVTRLSKRLNDRLQTLCLTEFMYDTDLTSYLDDYDKEFRYIVDDDPSKPYPYLGDVPSRFAGQTLNRLDIYRAIFTDSQDDELSAYALHRAIGCFASSGNNQCGDKQVDLSVRKAWFKRLKSDFSQTTWAKNQKYYW